MAGEMTDKEANALFAQVSKAVHDSDGIKLTELMDKEVVLDEPQVVEIEDPALEKKEEPVVEDDTETKDAPSEKTEEAVAKVDDKAVEPTEMEKLQTQLAQLSKENHSLRSQAGRVPHVQRRIQELDKKLEELANAKSSPASQTAAKIQPKVDELLKGIKETDSDLADAIAKAITAATSGVAEDAHTKERDTLEFLRSQEYRSYQEQESHRLLEMFPNAIEVFKSTSWAEWRKQQSPRVAGLADSDTAEDVAFAFQKYRTDMIAAHPELAEVKVDITATTGVINSEAANAAKRLETERQRKKETSVTVGSSNASGKVGMPDDPSALFAKFSEDIRKQRTGG